MKYPKIQTLWKRDNKTHLIQEGNFSKEEFENIKWWEVTEKIDGTNIRIIFEKSLDDKDDWKSRVFFKGRTDEAIIPRPLMKHLVDTFTLDKLKKVFEKSNKVILYGEGYGNKIQSIGRHYRKDNGFILFDVWIDGWWLERESVEDIAKKLGIKTVPLCGLMTKEVIINFVKSEPKSQVAEKDIEIEGIVARPKPLMLFRDGTPIMFKLKVKDYINLIKNEEKI